MCTVRIKVNEDALRRCNPSLVSVDAIRKWAQDVVDSRIEALAREQDVDDITTTDGYRAAMDDVANGRVSSYESVDDFFAEMKRETEAEEDSSNEI